MLSRKSFAPELFRRHAFVHLQPREEVFACCPGDTVLRDWIERALPLVVRRPCLSGETNCVCLGLALPPSPAKVRLAYELPLSSVLDVLDPPLWEECGAAGIPAIGPVQEAALAAGLELQVFGSHAWQHVTGLPYVTPDSDLDLILRINDLASWEELRMQLAGTPWPFMPRIDLEIILRDDASFQWCEFADTSSRLLFKSNSKVWMGWKRDIPSLLA